jgi:hypothetical protein
VSPLAITSARLLGSLVVALSSFFVRTVEVHRAQRHFSRSR